MMFCSIAHILVIALVLSSLGSLAPLNCQQTTADSSWPRFRGPSGSGTLPGDPAVPVRLQPDSAAWKTPLPAGHSSPVLWGSKIFLTGYDAQSKAAEVICVDRESGKILWRSPVPIETQQKFHPFNNPASSTAVLDAERVYVYFGVAGLFAFGHDGKPAWSLPLRHPLVQYGPAMSPVLSGDHVVLMMGGKDPVLLAVNRNTGKEAWRVPCGNPSDYTANAAVLLFRDQLIAHSWGQLAGFEAATGKRLWTIGTGTQGNSSPFSDGRLIFVSTWAFGEEDLFKKLPTWEELLERAQKEKGPIPVGEFPKRMIQIGRVEAENVPAANIFVQPARVDLNKDGQIDQAEWDAFLARSSQPLRFRHGLIALNPEGASDRPSEMWRESKAVSEIPTPILYHDRIYMVANGGVVTCLEAQTGKVLYRGRLGAGSQYYASPVASGGHVYFASSEGAVTVIRDGPELSVKARFDYGEGIFATPALAPGSIYLRTASHLYSFREKR